MLSAFIKEYALSCNFDKEYISDLMDANEDKGIYTLSFDEILVTLSELDIDGKKYVMYILLVESTNDETSLKIQAEKLQDFIKANSYSKNNFIVNVDLDNKTTSLFTVKKLDDLDQDAFNNFLEEGQRLVSAYLTKDKISHEYDFNLMDKNEAIVRSYFNEVSLNLDDLNRNIMRLELSDDEVALLDIDYENLKLELSSLIDLNLNNHDLLFALSENAALRGKRAFSIVDNALFFNSFIELTDKSSGNFLEVLNKHVLFVKEAKKGLKSFYKINNNEEWQRNHHILSV